MMITRTNELDIITALWLGADDYIMKPLHPEDMVNRIQQLATRIFI